MIRRSFLKLFSGLAVTVPTAGIFSLFHTGKYTVQITCRYPHPMLESEFQSHYKQIVSSEKFIALEQQMKSQGTLLGSSKIIGNECAVWDYTFRDFYSYMEWETSHMLGNFVDYKYADGTFQFSQQRKYI